MSFHNINALYLLLLFHLHFLIDSVGLCDYHKNSANHCCFFQNNLSPRNMDVKTVSSVTFLLLPSYGSITSCTTASGTLSAGSKDCRLIISLPMLTGYLSGMEFSPFVNQHTWMPNFPVLLSIYWRNVTFP